MAAAAVKSAQVCVLCVGTRRFWNLNLNNMVYLTYASTRFGIKEASARLFRLVAAVFVENSVGRGKFLLSR